MKGCEKMVKVTISLFVSVLMVGGAAFGQPFEIPRGTPIVDGDLSEWAGADWISMDQVYHGDPADLSGAKWAAKWAPEMIYLAVTGVDTDHVFTAAIQGWDQQDAVEVYVDAANGNVDGYNTDNFIQAQQYVGAPDGTVGGEWLTLAGTPLPAGTVPAFETTVVGDVINYEMAIMPYETYDSGDVASSTILTLADGMTIGLDVVMNTNHAGGFGMLCENTNGTKFGNAGQFMDLTLIPEPSAICLLVFGALTALGMLRLRRRRA